MPKTLYWVDKAELLLLLLGISDTGKIVPTLFRETEVSPERIKQLNSNFVKLLTEERETKQSEVFERILEHFEIRGPEWQKLVECLPGEFFGMLLPKHRAVLQNRMNHDRYHRLADDWKRISDSVDWIADQCPSLDVAYREILAASDMQVSVESIHISRDGAIRQALNDATWSLCKCLQKYSDTCFGVPEMIQLVVGPEASDGGLNFDRPTILAAGGHVNSALTQEGEATLKTFLKQTSEGLRLEWPPSGPAPIGERRKATKGLILAEWLRDSENGFPETWLSEFRIDGAQGDCLRCPVESILSSPLWRSMYLVLSDKVQMVHVFRVVDPLRNRRLVVSMDFLSNRELNFHQKANVLLAMNSVLQKLPDLGNGV